MVIFPAIDIRGGRCVRLLQGRFDVETVYAEDPSEVARRWERAGAKWIHVVDLDGALRGSSVNEGVVRRILEEVRVDVQLGGGIRSMEAIERWLSLGVKRVVLGTAAVKDPGFLRDAIREFGERVALSLDVKGGEVMLEGWRKPSGIKALQMAARAKEMGLSLLIYTDILKDGT
ncbi:MAG: 1-(5-phosphoribosyl)-5-((5-phosphoribosylamino)methylideneamino)imidazole-4-carboxamide isomerase, partial [Deltaproteobacteria bacterium]